VRPTSFLVSITSTAALAAGLAGCSAPGPSAPVSSSPTTTSSPGTATPAYTEYGRVTNIETLQGSAGSSGGPNVTNAVIGGILGAVVGNAVGHNSTGTVLGGVAGAAVGSQVNKAPGAPATNTIYRFTIQTDGGAIRTYDVGAIGDLRTGDRVRIANGVISRY
jgi:outer membrane lipoprotein SlyB